VKPKSRYGSGDIVGVVEMYLRLYKIEEVDE